MTLDHDLSTRCDFMSPYSRTRMSRWMSEARVLICPSGLRGWPSPFTTTRCSSVEHCNGHSFHSGKGPLSCLSCLVSFELEWSHSLQSSQCSSSLPRRDDVCAVHCIHCSPALVKWRAFDTCPICHLTIPIRQNLYFPSPRIRKNGKIQVVLYS